jgi:hypothetical protein
VLAGRVLVIGAGAAGLTAALRAAEALPAARAVRAAEAVRAADAGPSVTLWNAHPRPGLKILMSGGTRCNVTHAEVTERDFRGGSRPFVARVLRALPANAARAWLESLGVPLKLEATGKYFPITDDAHTVLEALLAAARAAGVACEWGRRAVRLERSDGGFRAGYQTVRDANAFRPVEAGFGRREWPLPAMAPEGWVEADRVVLATGGLSFPRTGSDGSGYALAAGLGHTVVPPVPALAPLVSNDPICAALQGTTVEAELSLQSGPQEARACGSLLFTHFGYSGPAALDLSRHWHRAASDERCVVASLLPGVTREHLLEEWRAAALARAASLRRLLRDRLPARLLEFLCQECELRPGDLVSQVPRQGRARFLDRLLARPLGVNGTLGFEKAECTAGGVSLSEVNPSTLESRLAPGLYLCGEILDVEGRLGGFNFQWAWSSGTVAGRRAAGT